MANNNNIFNAALSGASSGVSSRWLSNPSSASYASQVDLIEAFAIAFDAAIAPIVGGGSRGQVDAIQCICAAFWRDRIITVQTDLADAVSVLVALYTSLSSKILPDVGGGGGGSITPLSVELVVDPGADTGGDGAYSGDLAFDNLSDAIAACPSGGVIYLLPGDYTGEGAIDGDGKDVSIVGSSGLSASTLLPSLQNFGVLGLTDCVAQSVGDVDAVTTLRMVRARVTGNIHVTTGLNLINSSQLGNVTIDGSGGGGNVTAVMSSLDGTWNVAGGGTGDTDAPQVDEHSFSSLLFNGCLRSDSLPDWNVTHQLFAHMQNANRSIDNGYYGVGISSGTLSATRVLNISQSGMAVGARFRIDRYDSSAQQITVSGSTSGTVNLTNAGLVRHRYWITNNTGPIIAFQNLGRLAQA